LIFIVLNAEWIVKLTGPVLVVVFDSCRRLSLPLGSDCAAEVFITTPPAGFSVHPEKAKKTMARVLTTIAIRKNE
jgi:hypothetical protein